MKAIHNLLVEETRLKDVHSEQRINELEKEIAKKK